jgi:septum formation protein
MPTDTDESVDADLSMTETVGVLSERKARACFDKICSDPALKKEYANHIIIGADTIVWKNELMGKPADAEDAFRMLDAIRGTEHYVVTGVTLIPVDSGAGETLCDITEVHCINYSDDDIKDYISREEPYDKAGSYAIQGYFGRYIDRIEGDYENVVGLPFYRIAPLLQPYI